MANNITQSPSKLVVPMKTATQIDVANFPSAGLDTPNCRGVILVATNPANEVGRIGVTWTNPPDGDTRKSSTNFPVVADVKPTGMLIEKIDTISSNITEMWWYT